MANFEQKGRGLQAIEDSRHQRRRALVFGKVRIREAAPQFWLWTLVIFAAFGVIYWNVAQRELQSRISEVMAKQRAVAQELTPRLAPIRERLERHVTELAGDWTGNVLSPGLDAAVLGRSKGIYLRTLLSNARSVEDIRKAALGSLHDGFTSCMYANTDSKRASARACQTSAQCEPGELCGDLQVCAVPTQPYNARLMYRALRVLESEWSDALHLASDEYQVRVFENDLEKVIHDDVPLGVQLASGARYLTILLDELPPSGLPAEIPGEAAKGLNRPETRLQLVEHPVRLGIWDVQSDQLLARVRITTSAEVRAVGRNANASEESQRAQQRQANNCAIAGELRERLAAGAAPNKGAVLTAP